MHLVFLGFKADSCSLAPHCIFRSHSHTTNTITTCYEHIYDQQCLVWLVRASFECGCNCNCISWVVGCVIVRLNEQSSVDRGEE